VTDAAIRTYRDLIAWQKAMDLVEEIYKVTRGFPKEEVYALTSQLRRAVVSIASNIAEGHGRSGSREFVHRLSIAHGSLCEVETQVEIARRLGYITAAQQDHVTGIAVETGRLLNGLITSLERHATAH
jgi:four helix bundle protein